MNMTVEEAQLILNVKKEDPMEVIQKVSLVVAFCLENDALYRRHMLFAVSQRCWGLFRRWIRNMEDEQRNWRKGIRVWDVAPYSAKALEHRCYGIPLRHSLRLAGQQSPVGFDEQRTNAL